jgi:hypothetical protein
MPLGTLHYDSIAVRSDRSQAGAYPTPFFFLSINDSGLLVALNLIEPTFAHRVLQPPKLAREIRPVRQGRKEERPDLIARRPPAQPSCAAHRLEAKHQLLVRADTFAPHFLFQQSRRERRGIWSASRQIVGLGSGTLADTGSERGGSTVRSRSRSSIRSRPAEKRGGRAVERPSTCTSHRDWRRRTGLAHPVFHSNSFRRKRHRWVGHPRGVDGHG